jgi:hypothetical protein
VQSKRVIPNNQYLSNRILSLTFKFILVLQSNLCLNKISFDKILEMKKLTILGILLGLSFACQNANPIEEEAASPEAVASSEGIKKEVMDLHDKVMPEMTTMSKLQGKLQESSIGSADSINYMKAAQDLKFAKQAMMEWMRNFSGTYNDNMTEEEKVTFLEAEKTKMLRIDSLTLAAIDNGQEIVTAMPVAQDSL